MQAEQRERLKRALDTNDVRLLKATLLEADAHRGDTLAAVEWIHELSLALAMASMRLRVETVAALLADGRADPTVIVEKVNSRLAITLDGVTCLMLVMPMQGDAPRIAKMLLDDERVCITSDIKGFAMARECSLEVMRTVLAHPKWLPAMSSIEFMVGSIALCGRGDDDKRALWFEHATRGGIRACIKYHEGMAAEMRKHPMAPPQEHPLAPPPQEHPMAPP